MSQVISAEIESLRYVDRFFARWLVDNFAQAYPAPQKAILYRLALAVSHAVHLKHTCLDLSVVTGLADNHLSGMLDEIDEAVLEELLATMLSQAIPPLVFSADGKRIWLQKYHFFEQQCARNLLARAGNSQPLNQKKEQLLDEFFAEPTEQKTAARKALQQSLAVITGGPGTGKTFTVARIIAILLLDNPETRITLAAPTGKAGQRMKEALDKAIAEDEILSSYRDLLQKVPEKTSTLHSLLGISQTSPKARRHSRQPLALDVLIIDEASMIDLPMMYRLLDALPAQARLVLLGDKDQLASVEAGSVLAELCQSTRLQACMANITLSRRFGPDSEIGNLARWLNDSAVSALPDMNNNKNVIIHDLPKDNPWQPEWLAMACKKYLHIRELIAGNVQVMDILAEQKRFQILCALREGPQGVKGINSLVERSLQENAETWYAGKPVMIVQNDHERKLYNGDVGIILPLNEQGTAIDIHGNNLKACFLSANSFRAISLAQMPLHETCYAMTIHKSQGSEYQHVLIVLPAQLDDVKNNPVLSKELAYTAVTRASEKIDLWVGDGVMDVIALRKTVRMSGLAFLME